MNWAQDILWNDPHPLKVILKARQLGITTYFCLLHLDKVLWNDNIQCGLIAHTRDDASNLFKDKLKFAFDNLHPAIRSLFRIQSDSAGELSFSNGSLIRVGTSLRSSTLQYLHISEFGKICAKYPEKAVEVVSGAINTVQSGQSIIIESTAEGKEGFYYDMWLKSWTQLQKKRPFGSLDFKPTFFPWWKEPSYVLSDELQMESSEVSHHEEYFSKLNLEGIVLSDDQRKWYIKKYQLQKELMLREYPSTPDEAFQASQEGYWYSIQMRELHEQGHITNVSYDRALPVHTAWDLGQADFTVIWFFQITRSGEINLIDYFQKSDCRIDQLANILKSKGYTYGHHIWPHDADARDRAGITFVQQARAFGLTGIPLEKHALRDGINLVRATLGKCWFDAKKCHEGIISLENYKKQWSSAISGFTSEDVSDQYAHGADAFRYMCAGINKIKESSGSLESDYRALRNYWG